MVLKSFVHIFPKNIILMCKFRTLNYKLPVETGRYTNIPRNHRYCTLCNQNRLDDEFHVVLECLLQIRTKIYIAASFCKHVNLQKFRYIFSSSTRDFNKIGKFIWKLLNYYTVLQSLYLLLVIFYIIFIACRCYILFMYCFYGPIPQVEVKGE